MTDGLMYTDCETQTARPAVNLAFTRYLEKNNSNASIDDKISLNETTLRAQIKELKELDAILYRSSSMHVEAEKSNEEIIEPNKMLDPKTSMEHEDTDILSEDSLTSNMNENHGEMKRKYNSVPLSFYGQSNHKSRVRSANKHVKKKIYSNILGVI